jgi:hypothetical protein
MLNYYASNQAKLKHSYKPTHIKGTNLLYQLGRKVQARQKAIATALVYFTRFWSLTEIDEYQVLAVTCLYVALKTQEQPVHLKTLVNEFNQSSTLVILAKDVSEFEFYLIEQLDYCLIVYTCYTDLDYFKDYFAIKHKNMLQNCWFGSLIQVYCQRFVSHRGCLLSAQYAGSNSLLLVSRRSE